MIRKIYIPEEILETLTEEKWFMTGVISLKPQKGFVELEIATEVVGEPEDYAVPV